MIHQFNITFKIRFIGEFHSMYKIISDMPKRIVFFENFVRQDFRFHKRTMYSAWPVGTITVLKQKEGQSFF